MPSRCGRAQVGISCLSSDSAGRASLGKAPMKAWILTLVSTPINTVAPLMPRRRAAPAASPRWRPFVPLLNHESDHTHSVNRQVETGQGRHPKHGGSSKPPTQRDDPASAAGPTANKVLSRGLRRQRAHATCCQTGPVRAAAAALWLSLPIPPPSSATTRAPFAPPWPPNPTHTPPAAWIPCLPCSVHRVTHGNQACWAVCAIARPGKPKPVDCMYGS